MTIAQWPKEDRPREKLLAKGEQSLTDAELLAILIKSGTRGKTALDIARELLAEHGHLKKLLNAPPHLLIKKPGMGLAKYATFRAAIELGLRYVHETLPVGSIMNTSEQIHKFLTQQLCFHANEVFACLFMDTKLRLIRFEELFYGTVNESNVYPREIVRRGLLHNAAKIILAHNHPSGNPIPSKADHEITKFIKDALLMVDIEVVDHVIVGNPDHFSFAEAGLI